MDTDLARITVEAVSAIACLILVRFMLKPYQLTKQGRYLGLPLGFGILGINYVFTIMLLTTPFLHNAALSWLAHFTRVFAFVFLALTYYFSTKTTQTYRLLWDFTLVSSYSCSCRFIPNTDIHSTSRFDAIYRCPVIHSKSYNSILIVHYCPHTKKL